MPLVLSQMVEILFQYVDRSVKKCPEQGKIQLLEQHFQVDEALKALASPYRAIFILFKASYLCLSTVYYLSTSTSLLFIYLCFFSLALYHEG